jgi:adenylate cyclase
VIDPKIAQYRGRIVKTTGDGALVEFASAVDASRCAIEIQGAVAERNVSVPVERRVELRIGINVGDILIEDGDIFGDGVNIAARIEGIAQRGGSRSRKMFGGRCRARWRQILSIPASRA